MALFSFGKRRIKRRTVKRSGNKKPPAALRKLAKKYRVKISLKRGRRRIYKKVSVIKREIKKKIRKLKKRKNSKVRKVRKTKRRATFRFGMSGSVFQQPKAYGYHQKVEQYPGTLSQSGSYVTKSNNINRPPGMGLSSKYIPTKGTYARFFTEKVPRTVPPNWMVMGQPSGPPTVVGSPFYRYTKSGRSGRRKGGRRSMFGFF